MINHIGERNIRKIVENAIKLNTRRRASALLMMKNFQSVEDWVDKRPNTIEYYYEVHNKVAEALSVLLADPSAPLPPVLDIIVSGVLDSHYPEIDFHSATYPHVTIVINFVMAQYVSRRLIKSPIEEQHRKLYEYAFKVLWTRFGKELGEFRYQWEAIDLLLAVAFGDYHSVIKRFNTDLQLNMTTFENSHRTLIKLAYLLAQCATCSTDDVARFGAKALCTLTQFNYYLWIVRQDTAAQIDIVTMVFASQLLQKTCESLPEDTQAFFEALSPGAVAFAMQCASGD